ncbi:amino acid transporter [Pseudoroseomonas deserti]|uniref:Amino acid transporter n=1 Tax=Teichococcus deserti TaxID=1817963 RepID=A0A1V2H0Z4_9PROT|nr:APC family permease [Pseudoroseomonas deserti]ONG50170.1 amino acid transporter [Pseudoroseomonas deserti]
MRSLAKALLGRRLANREGEERRIGAFEGVPAMGLDGLGSSSYGPEAALTILAAAGTAGLAALGPIIAAIVALLAILYFSYRQTIAAYPTNGGAFTVARETFGAGASLLAAAALMIDYVLNVAVGISAGVGALTSAVPSLQPQTLPLCLGILALLTLINLRGTLDAGRAFALPTYLFLASFALLLGLGLYRLLATGEVAPVVAPPPPRPASEPLGWWLVLHAFASGCTAMTGVEAVSNGMGAFRDPAVRHGRRTLLAICGALGLLLIGIATLATAYGIGAMDQTQPGYRSVLSQLAAAVLGHGWLYYTAIGSLLCVLALSADTSFTAFPRLCRSVAQDGYLPRAFAVAGRRLVFSAGILYLAATAALLLILFGGITEHLIPLFAIGAFLTFTISQAGMVVHWRRLDATAATRRHRLPLLVNAAGALATGIAFCVILVAKFSEGAWITLLAVPATIAGLLLVRRYYDRVAAQERAAGPLRLAQRSPPVVIIAMAGRSRMADEALRFALDLSPDVVAVHLTALEGGEDPDRAAALRESWRHDVEDPAARAGLTPPRLVVLPATYRRAEEPLLKLIGELRPKMPGRRVAILIPELVKRRWYQHLLHTHRARRLRRRLLAHADPEIVIIIIPWAGD